MRDAMTAAAAVFEPEEVLVLAAALRLATSRMHVEDAETKAELARLIHNLGRSRIRLRKLMQTDAHAAEIAGEAAELFAYLEEAPETILAAAREADVSSTRAERIIGAFPTQFRQTPVNRL